MPAAKKFKEGSAVSVLFGLNRHEAMVIETTHQGRVVVSITIDGADEPIVTSYLPEEVTVPSAAS